MKFKTYLREAAAALTVCAVVLSTGATAFAADTETDTSAYSYRAGQQATSDRHARFAELSGMTDEERAAFFEENGIGGAHKGGRQLDTEALLAAGIIDQDTADRIAEAASEKHEKLHENYEALSGMDAEERHAFFKGEAFDRPEGSDERDPSARRGNPVDRLLSAGIITEAQADAINEYLAAQAAQ